MDDLTRNPLAMLVIGAGLMIGVAVPVMSYTAKFIDKHLPDVKKEEKKSEDDPATSPPDPYALLNQIMFHQSQRDLIAKDTEIMKLLNQVQAELTATKNELSLLKAAAHSSPDTDGYDGTERSDENDSKEISDE